MIQKYLPSRFHMAMLQIYDDACALCRGYRAPQFLQLVSDKGGLEAARFLLRGTTPASGFAELLLCERLDLSMEALVMLEPWCQLFTQEELGQARQRLAGVGFLKPTMIHNATMTSRLTAASPAAASVKKKPGAPVLVTTGDGSRKR